MNEFIVRPIINLLLVLYRALGHHTILAIVMVTVIFRLALVPLTLRRRLSHHKSARKREELKSNIKKIEEEYRNDPVRMTQEQIKLYQDVNLNPMGGCLITLIQLPILIGVYRAIVHVLAVTPLRLLELPGQIYPWLPNLSTLIPLNSRFLWLDLALRDPYFVLPTLVFVAACIRNKIALPTSSQTMEKWGRYMDIAMPMLVTYLSASYAAGLAIYILLASLIGILEYMLFIRPYAAKLREQQNAKSGSAEPQTATHGAISEV
ncbi:MAG: membrane protein insertase YidC [Anaerolineae bacterium]|nr:membrane protein insertase YidC [Anaerolineae bacterium]